MTIRRMLPLALRAAASRNQKHAEALERAALRCEQEGTREAARHAKSVANSAYAAYAAADAAADGAAADAAAAVYAAATRTRDRVLAQYAEWVVEVLIEMQAPGCQWLVLAPKVAA